LGERESKLSGKEGRQRRAHFNMHGKTSFKRTEGALSDHVGDGHPPLFLPFQHAARNVGHLPSPKRGKGEQNKKAKTPLVAKVSNEGLANSSQCQ
jgi:hypothetical protein